MTILENWQRIDTRVRFLSICSSIIIVATSWSVPWWRLAIFTVCPLILLSVSGASWRDLFLHLSVVSTFLVLAGIFAVAVPFVASEGRIHTHRYIFLVCVTIFSVSSIQLLSLGPNSNATFDAIRRLGIPHDIMWTIILAIRYIPLIKEEGIRIHQAARARLWSPRKRTLRVIGWISASIFIRSFEKALRTAQAMEARGYGNARRSPVSQSLSVFDLAFLILYPGIILAIRFIN